MEKKILVFYVSVGNLPRNEAISRMRAVQDTVGKEEEGIIKYFVPIRGESKVECLNPTKISDEEYLTINQKLEALQQKIEETLKFKQS